MINKEQRKYIREALILVKLTKNDKNYSEGRFNAIIELLELSDKTVKNLKIPVVMKSF
tara:strand:+ start:252 stop:425 length:174 start_codon:yes stop_codon:yes gene_type:complete